MCTNYQHENNKNVIKIFKCKTLLTTSAHDAIGQWRIIKVGFNFIQLTHFYTYYFINLGLPMIC